MTIRYYYIGGTGPYFIDDTINLLDPDNNFPGETQHAIVTDGQLIVEETPSEDYNVARLIDILENITETFTATGTINKNTRVAIASGTFDLFLPTLANGDKRIYEVKNYGTGIVTLKPNATEAAKTIDEETSQAIRSLDAVTVYGNNINDSWWII
jgi:hypothetical protein